MILEKELSQRPSKQKIYEIVSYIGDDPIRFAHLIALVLSREETVSKYASWLISHCMENNQQLIQPQLRALIENLERPDLNDSVLRSTVKALAATDVPSDLQGRALHHCFDLLLDAKQAVSIQVHAMQAVFNLSENEPDLLRELGMVIEERLPNGTAGYKARGRRILKKIDQILAKG